MPSETFHCPRCKRELTKSAQAYVFGEMMQNQGTSFIGLGGIAETVTCPGCGHAIDAQRMMQGDYDKRRGGITFHDMIAAGIGAACAVGLYTFASVPWWGGVIAFFVITIGFDEIFLRPGRRKKLQQSR